MAVRQRAGRGRPPAGRGRGRPAPEPEEDLLPPEPPFWERIILSKTFRLVVGATFASAAIAILTFLVGPATIGSAVGGAFSFAGSQTKRLGLLGSVAVAQVIQDEGRRLWVETATPLPTPEPTSTPLPTATPFPTPPPPRRLVATATPPFPNKPAAGLAPVKPGVPTAAPAQVPVDAAASSQTEYFEILSSGDVRRALQYWAPESAPEARSALDAAAARGEKYRVKAVTPRIVPQIGGVDLTVELDITDSTGKTTPAQHRYQWRFVENQWYITTRLQ